MLVKNVLVTTDFSDDARRSYACAARLARKFDAKVHLVHVEEALPLVLPDTTVSAYLDDLEGALAKECENVAFVGVKVLSHLLRDDKRFLALNEFDESHDINVVVTSTHGRTGVERFVLGSFAERVVRTSSVPVLVCRKNKSNDQDAVPRSVLVPVDFSERTRMVLPMVKFLSAQFGCSFSFLYVHEMVPHQFPYYDTLHGLAGRAMERAGHKFEELKRDELRGVAAMLETAEGVPFLEINAKLKNGEFDLVLIGTRGSPGSVAQNVTRSAPCSVLTMRQPARG